MRVNAVPNKQCDEGLAPRFVSTFHGDLSNSLELGTWVGQNQNSWEWFLASEAWCGAPRPGGGDQTPLSLILRSITRAAVEVSTSLRAECWRMSFARICSFSAARSAATRRCAALAPRSEAPCQTASLGHRLPPRTMQPEVDAAAFPFLLGLNGRQLRRGDQRR